MTSLSTELFAPLRFPALSSGGGASDAADDAVQRGYAAGLARGRRRAEQVRDQLLATLEADAAATRRSAEARLAQSLEALEDARLALDRRVVPVLDEAAHAVFEAAVTIAEAVLGAELDDDERAAKAALHRALAHPAARIAVAVRMAPAAIAALGAAGVKVPVDLVADPALEPGDAIADLPDGLIDARLGAAVERARRALMGGAL